MKNNSAENAIRTWLKSGSNDVCYISHDDVEYAYFRHRIRDDLDMIYAYEEVKDKQIKFRCAPQFQCVYKISTNELYMVADTTENIIGRNMFDANSYYMLKSNFIEDVRESVEEEVAQWKVEIDEESRTKQTPYAEAVARSQYLKDRNDEFHYVCGYNAEHFEKKVFDCIIDAKATAQKTANRFCEKHKDVIMQALIRDRITEELIKEYREGKNRFLVTLYNIIHAIPKHCKTVNVTTLMDGHELTFKYDAGQLRQDCRCGYNTWYLSNSDRNLYYTTYGDCRDFTPNDIIRITYSRKVLYERKA